MASMLGSQLDYIYFFFGLVLFLLGAVCVSMSRTGPLPTPWWLLGLFAFAHGAAQWLGLLAFTVGDTPAIAGLRIVVVACSFAFLLEFARRVQAILVWRTVPAWVYVPLGATILVLAATSGLAATEAAVRLLLGAPAAFWTAYLFRVAAVHTEDIGGGPRARRARIWGSAYFAAFGVVAGLLVPAAGILPDWWPTQEGFAVATGVPTQLVRALLVAGMALSVWVLAVSFDPKGAVLRKRRQLFWAMASSIALIVAGGWLLTNLLGNVHEKDILADARSAAAQVHDHLAMEMQEAEESARTLAALLSRFHVDGRGELDRSRLADLVASLSGPGDRRVLYVLDRAGDTIAASNRDRPDSFVGQNYSERPYFRSAIAGGAGRFMGIGRTSGIPGYYASEPVVDGAGAVVAVAVSKRNLGPDALGPLGTARAFLITPSGQVTADSARGLDPGDGPAGLGLDELAPGSARAGPSPGTAVGVGGTAHRVTAGARRLIFVRRALAGTDWTLVVAKDEKTQVANRLLGIFITLLFGAVILTYFVAMQRQFGAESRITIKRAEAEGRARELARQADTDALTGVLNRHGFNAVISAEVARARRYGQALSVVMLDLDHFKSVNDRFGHPAGDKVLVNVAALLQTYVRESDTVARWGGEEFVVVAPMTGLDGAVQLAEKLRARMASSRLGPDGAVTASLGVAELEPGESVDAFLHRADQALYQAKANGRNRVERGSRPGGIAERGGGHEGKEEGPMDQGKELYARTGFAPMDEEHEALGDGLERLIWLVNSGDAQRVREALDGVVRGIAGHFRHEERLMAESMFPNVRAHEEAHGMFEEDTRLYQQELLAHGLTPRFRRWAVGRLPEWFRFHILVHDIALGHFLLKVGKGAGGATGSAMATEVGGGS